MEQSFPCSVGVECSINWSRPEYIKTIIQVPGRVPVDDLFSSMSIGLMFFNGYRAVFIEINSWKLA